MEDEASDYTGGCELPDIGAESSEQYTLLPNEPSPPPVLSRKSNMGILITDDSNEHLVCF